MIMAIGLGHPRLVNNDLNLLAQFITLAIILISLYFKKKGKIKQHGITMGIAVVVHILTFVMVMGPIFFQNFSYYSTELGVSWIQAIWLHAVPGALVLVLAVFLVIAWVIRASDVSPCYKRKRIMDVTLVLWVISLAFGILTYGLTYF